MRSKSRCSKCPAIHINSRSWLRSSSTDEPSDPLPRVVFSKQRLNPVLKFHTNSRMRQQQVLGFTGWKWFEKKKAGRPIVDAYFYDQGSPGHSRTHTRVPSRRQGSLRSEELGIELGIGKSLNVTSRRQLRAPRRRALPVPSSLHKPARLRVISAGF